MDRVCLGQVAPGRSQQECEGRAIYAERDITGNFVRQPSYFARMVPSIKQVDRQDDLGDRGRRGEERNVEKQKAEIMAPMQIGVFVFACGLITQSVQVVLNDMIMVYKQLSQEDTQERPRARAREQCILNWTSSSKVFFRLEAGSEGFRRIRRPPS